MSSRPTASHPPAPFIVGAARSGTTLLRLMLDAHPRLAIPPETTFVPQVAAAGAMAPEEFVEALTASPTWADMGVDHADLVRAVQALDPFDTADGVRAFFRLYAARHGKQRWGNKTPWYGRHQHEIRRLLPEGRFIHIIRDGRDVALSLRGLPFAPGEGRMEDLARQWRDEVTATREQGAAHTAYLEVRFEELVTRPGRVLRRCARFLDLPYSRRMLRSHRTSEHRLAELADYDDGQTRMSAEERRRSQRHTLRPPDPGRIAVWRTQMPADDRRGFDDVAGPLLSALGYPDT